MIELASVVWEDVHVLRRMAAPVGLAVLCTVAVHAGSPWAGTDVVPRAAGIVAKVNWTQ